MGRYARPGLHELNGTLRYDGRRVCLRSRPGQEFPELGEVADALAARGVILDGELVCLDREGKADFACLASAARTPPGVRRARR
ncbi:MAG: hypothetical protein JO168_22255 [Solirubrobacterales bacterium]|nr:hypothetical protein [Solirubrobacterales bacterium]